MIFFYGHKIGDPMNYFPSVLDFSDVKDSPRVKMSLPGPLPLGTRLLLNFSVRRKNGNRTEEFHASGEFKVIVSALDATGPTRQVVSVEAIRVAPSWRAVKNTTDPKRRLPPARSPRTVVV